MMCVWLCLACHLRPTNHEPVFGIRHIGGQIMRGCACAVLRDCNMIELVHAKLTHTYAATRLLSGMHVGRASVMFSVFQFFRCVWASWRREGYWIPRKHVILADCTTWDDLLLPQGRMPWGSGLHRCQSLLTKDNWHRRFELLPWWPPLRTWACPYVSLCSSYVRLVTGTSS